MNQLIKGLIACINIIKIVSFEDLSKALLTSFFELKMIDDEAFIKCNYYQIS